MDYSLPADAFEVGEALVLQFLQQGQDTQALALDLPQALGLLEAQKLWVAQRPGKYRWIDARGYGQAPKMLPQ